MGTTFRVRYGEIGICVSIQLMSPASGDAVDRHQTVTAFLVSIQLMSPASGDSLFLNKSVSIPMFPFN